MSEMTSRLIDTCVQIYRDGPYTSAFSILALVSGLAYWTRIANVDNTDRLESVRRAVNEPSKRYKTDTSSSKVLTLPDGRKLGYAEYGVPNGRPLFNLHGLPGSRIEAAALEPVALRLGIRIIGVDRPGYGLSSAKSKCTLLDHPQDLIHLAEHLGLEEYAVLGTSGGGPYALACAYALPSDKLKAVAVVCGMGAPDMSKKGMNIMHRAGFSFGYLYFPWICRLYMNREPHARLDLPREERAVRLARLLLQAGNHPKDLELFDTDYAEDIIRLLVPNHEASFGGQGVDAVVQDGQVMCSDWGFKLEDVRKDLPVNLWYGNYDVNCPPIHGIETKERIGDNAVLHLEDETHGSITFNLTWGGANGDRARVLQELVKSAGWE